MLIFYVLDLLDVILINCIDCFLMLLLQLYYHHLNRLSISNKLLLQLLLILPLFIQLLIILSSLLLHHPLHLLSIPSNILVNTYLIHSHTLYFSHQFLPLYNYLLNKFLLVHHYLIQSLYLISK